MDFGAPLLSDLNEQQPIELKRAALQIVITVWNAHVMAMPVWGKPELLERLNELLAGPNTAPEMIRACTQLSRRRLEQFANDPRAVAEWSLVSEGPDQLRFRCDGRVPPCLMPRSA